MNTYRLGLILIFTFLAMTVGTAGALDKDQADEFAALSGQSRQAMDLSVTELEALTKRCDLLLKAFENLSASEKKIMVKRLKRVRGLFLYVQESKQSAKE